MPTAADLVTLFVSLWLIAGEHAPTTAEVGYLMWADNASVMWEVGLWLGLVAPAERPWASIRPFNPPSDHRHDLELLRVRAHPKPPPMRVTN